MDIFTAAAREALKQVPEDDRARVRDWARRIARARGGVLVGQDDVWAALMCAGEEFLPEEEE